MTLSPFAPKPLCDWLKKLNPADPVLTANFTDEEFDKVCMLLRKWASDRIGNDIITDMKLHPEKYLK